MLFLCLLLSTVVADDGLAEERTHEAIYEYFLDKFASAYY